MLWPPLVSLFDCKYVGPSYCHAKMYAGRVACCPMVSHDEYADGTDRRTPDRYIKSSARRGPRTNMGEFS